MDTLENKDTIRKQKDANVCLIKLLKLFNLQKGSGLLGMWMWWNTLLLLCRLKMMSRWDVCKALISDILASVLRCATRWRCVIHLCFGSGANDENVCLLHLEREGGDGKSIFSPRAEKVLSCFLFMRVHFG